LIRADELRSEIELKVATFRNKFHIGKLEHIEKLCWDRDPEIMRNSCVKLRDVVGVESFNKIIHESQIRNEC
jgi:hypothetical protein